MCLLLLWTGLVQADVPFEHFYFKTHSYADFAPAAELWFSGLRDIDAAPLSKLADSAVVNGSNVRLQMSLARFPSSNATFC